MNQSMRKSDVLARAGLENIVLKPILEYGTKLMNEKMIIKKVVTDTEFIALIPEMKASMILKQIPYEEDLSRWIQLPPHSNVVGCFDTFEHTEGEKVYKFSLQEQTNNGDMYKYI